MAGKGNSEWVMCPNGCGARLYYREVQMHVQTVCSERREFCSMGCGELVRWGDRKKHKMLFCNCRIVKCEYAPACKWSGQFKDLAVHTSNFMTLKEKQKLVPGDPSIECLERPWICWRPPLVAPAQAPLNQEGGYMLRWAGCGNEIKWRDRTRHESRECHFRIAKCPNGCGMEILGYRLQEHLEGKPLLHCTSTAAWVASGCVLRDVLCMYVLGQKKEGADRAARKGKRRVKTKGLSKSPVRGSMSKSPTRGSSSKSPTRASTSLSPARTSSKNLSKPGTSKSNASKKGVTFQEATEGNVGGEGGNESQEDTRKISIISLYEPEVREREKQMLLNWDIRVEEGCSEKMLAQDVLEHQKADCSERFVMCKHDCGQFIKYREQFSHEDEKHANQQDIHLAAEDGNLERVKDHVLGRDGARKFPVSCRDEHGDNCLHYACRSKEHEVIKYLIANNCDVNAKGAHGRTPMMISSSRGDTVAAELLLRANADLGIQDDSDGWTALHHAVFNAKEAVADILVKAGADLNITDTRRLDTPLHMALVGGKEVIAELLANAGANKNSRNNRKVNVYYHTFDKLTGKPKDVRRGDVAFDLARSDEMRHMLLPDLVDDIKTKAWTEGIDPRFGSTFETAKGHRTISPAKYRATHYEVSPNSSPVRGSLMDEGQTRNTSKSPGKRGSISPLRERSKEDV